MHRPYTSAFPSIPAGLRDKSCNRRYAQTLPDDYALAEQYDEDDAKSLDKKLIKQAMNERQMYHEEIIENAKGQAPKASTNTKKADANNEDDIPF